MENSKIKSGLDSRDQEISKYIYKVLSSLIPYDTIVRTSIYNMGTNNIEYTDKKLDLEILNSYKEEDNINLLPYLRPMSDMTQSERDELKKLTCSEGTGYFEDEFLVCPATHIGDKIPFYFMYSIIDYLNSRHLDYLHLIDKLMALEAKSEMYQDLKEQ